MADKTVVSPAPGDFPLPDDVEQLLSEDLVAIRQAARAAGIDRLSYYACLRAIRGGQLQAVKIAGRLFTSVNALRRWIGETNERRTLPPPPRRRGRKTRPVTSAAERAVLRSRRLPTGADR